MEAELCTETKNGIQGGTIERRRKSKTDGYEEINTPKPGRLRVL
jgi:hypothetical protein